VRWGNAALVVILTATGFVGLALAEQRDSPIHQEASTAVLPDELTGVRGVMELPTATGKFSHAQDGWQDRARRAFCDPYLATASQEIEHLKAQVTRSAGDKQKHTEECERVIVLSRALAPEQAKYAVLERELVDAQDEIQRLKEQVRIGVDTKIATEERLADQTRALAQEREKVVALSLEIDLARQELERATERTKLGSDQGNTRERARAAALDRDLRAARKELQRLREERGSSRVSAWPFGL
jgi:DNA repair exonuclease SbcCD ATPase subunit